MNEHVVVGKRQQALEQMANEFTMDTARAIVRAIADAASISCERAADIMIDAWERTTVPSPEELERDAECFEKIMMYP